MNMKTFEFQCGGDRGSWECLVDVTLSKEEESRLKAYAQNHEQLEPFPPIDDIYWKVISSLKDQCEDDETLENVMVLVPFGLKEI